MKSLTEYLNEAENYSVGDAFSFEFADLLSVDTVIVDIVEDGVVVNIDDKGINLLIENNLTLEEKARDDYHKDIDGDHVGEGYKILPPMDKEKYQERDGLEGPFSTLSGKVVYYDPKKGSYYDPDTDMYISYSEFQDYDKDYSNMRKDEDMDADAVRLKVASTLDAQEGPVNEATTVTDHPVVKHLVALAKEIQDDDYRWSESDYLDFNDAIEPILDNEELVSQIPMYPEMEEDDPDVIKAKIDKLAAFGEVDEAVEGTSNNAINKLRELAGLPVTTNEADIDEAEYRGRKVTLNKPTRGDVKKFKVYVKDPKTGNIKKVNFGHGGTSAKKAGQKTMKIKKSNPARRKSFRARHNCDNPGPKTKARYWSCRAW